MVSNIALGPIGQIARRVRDVNAAVQWYRDALGLRFLYQFGGLAFFDCAGTRLFLSSEGSEAGVENSILYFRVDDIHVAYESLRARGVVFLEAPRMIFKHPDGTEEWMAFFQDLDGGALALMSQVKT